MNAIGTKQQDRSERAGTVLLDNLTQDIQDLLERNAGSDHLEKALFTAEQRLPSLALGDVYGSANVTIDFARLPSGRSAHTLDMLNGAVRKRDSKFHLESPFLPNCFIETSLNK